MLTDGSAEAWDGVSGVADEVTKRGGSLVTTILLGLVVFAVGAAVGFVTRLLWPHSRWTPHFQRLNGAEGWGGREEGGHRHRDGLTQ